ncbi:MAG TPA: TlpA disulfide reductase family protein, partial [candidate division Zixibacteria bacterium]|nr:TlpA disulfide reductase family protein [candidate division Zixibacteria bacterium]
VWATWCRPCVAETPELVAFARAQRDSGLRLIGVSTDYFTVDDTTALRKVTAFQQTQQIPYANLIYTGGVDDLTTQLDLPGPLPTTILFNPTGEAVEQISGRLEDADFVRIATTVSAGAAPGT